MEDRIQRQPQAWLHARARLLPRSLIEAAPWVRGVFDYAWAPMRALARQIHGFPSDLWEFLLGCAGGYVAIGPGDSRYVPGPVVLRHQPTAAKSSGTLQNVAFVSVEDLAAGNERPLHVLGHLIDHHLGCAGELDALWLSEGGGVTPSWREAGTRLPPLFALGYGVDEIAQANRHDYFAQSLALYCLDRQRLNVADPQIAKWFRNSLWNPAFWQEGNTSQDGQTWLS